MKPITPWRRRVLRLPIILYRLRLGMLMGRRVLLLTHIGRRRCLSRRTVLEVPLRDGPTLYLASGWGPGADWYQNLRAHPRAEVVVGARSLVVDANLLDPMDSGRLTARYADEHPRLAWAQAKAVGWVADGEPDWYDLGHDHVPWVRLTVVR